MCVSLHYSCFSHLCCSGVRIKPFGGVMLRALSFLGKDVASSFPCVASDFSRTRPSLI